jgi:hypothetical protein
MEVRTMDEQLSDKDGKTLDRLTVEGIAFDNITGSMSQSELITAYIATLDDAALVQWATDADGRFPASCARCGSPLDASGLCTDVTCPYSDRPQGTSFTED